MIVASRPHGVAVGAANRVAVEAGVQLATAAAPPFSLLVIQGPTGTGKTELIRAIATVHEQHRGSHPVHRFSAHKLTTSGSVAAALGEDLIGCGLLLLDDFDLFLRRDPTVGLALLTALDFMSRDDRRIAIASGTPLTDLGRIEPRLLSRLFGGLVVDVDWPEQTLREDIIRQKAAVWPMLDLAPHIVAFVARKLGGNGHLLAGAVNRLGLYSVSFPGEVIDELVVDRELAELLRAAPRVSVADIQGRVAQYFGIPVGEMTSARRARDVARPRQVAMYLSKQLTPKSLPDIGRRFGNRDHTTVIHGIRQVERLRETDCDIDRAVLSLTRELQQ